jgi:hypothetical protein
LHYLRSYINQKENKADEITIGIKYLQLIKTGHERQFFDDTCDSTSDRKFETAIIDISIYIFLYLERELQT